MSKKKDPAASKIFIEEYFAAQDDRFVDAFRQNPSVKYLAGFIEKWLKDTRPWAREQLVVYLGRPWTCFQHDVVYKRICKHFFVSDDHEMMGVLMCELDRLVRRNRVKRWHYNRKTRQSWTTESLVAPIVRINRWQSGKKAQRNRPFSNLTRNFLRRAGWRYFRILSHQQPEVYVKQVARALARYRDSDFLAGENIIDNWALMHACFHYHDSIQFTQSHANLVNGGSLNDLSPAPYQPEAWKSDAAMAALLELIVEANSSLVRIWAMDLFLQNHEDAVGKIPLLKLIKMMASPDERLQQFAAEAFETHPDLPTLTVQQWLELLDESGVGQLPRLCDAMEKHVAEERLENDQVIALSCARQVPVAMLGFKFAQSRDQRTPFSAGELSRLADLQCAQQAPAITTWAIERICQRDNDGLADHVIGFFDSLIKPTRIAAMDWLSEPDSAGYNRAKLWTMLLETPFDDVKLRMVDLLHHRKENPRGETDRWAAVWVAVILGVNRGGRTKPKALDQLAGEIIRHPESEADLLSVLAVAVRSIRETEMRYGLTSVARILESRPELATKIQQAIPELEFSAMEGV